MSLVDTVGSLAVASRGHYMTGVSTGERTTPIVCDYLGLTTLSKTSLLRSFGRVAQLELPSLRRAWSLD